MVATPRVPRLLSALKTHPGGHRGQHLFDPRILGLWRVLVNKANQETFEVVLNMTQLAKTFGVARSTMQRWLGFLERHHLLSVTQRHGGHGCGLTASVTWLKNGVDLARKREKALAYKRERMRRKAQTVAQRQTTFTSLRDDKNRTYLMAELRTVLASTIHRPAIAHEATQAFGRWIWKSGTTTTKVEAVLKALRATETIATPRWVTSAQDVHKWVRSLIAKLLNYGAAWWSRLQRTVECRTLNCTLDRIKAQVENKTTCPICGYVHDLADWREGRNAQGQLNCAGWARLKLAELRERKPPSVPLDRRTTSSMACWTCGRQVERLYEGRCPSCYRCAAKGKLPRRVEQPQAKELKARLVDLERERRETLRLHDTPTLRLAWADLIAQCQAEILSVTQEHRHPRGNGDPDKILTVSGCLLSQA